MKKTLLCIVIGMVFLSLLNSRDIYVRTNGSNSNNGTAAYPYLTISYGIGQALSSNENCNIYINPGTYTENLIIDGFTHSLTLRRWGGTVSTNDVIINGLGTSSVFFINESLYPTPGTNSITLTDMDIRNGVGIWGNNGQIYDHWGGGIYADQVGRINIDHCNISNNSGGHGGGIGFYNCLYSNVSNSNIFSNSMTGNYKMGGGVYLQQGTHVFTSTKIYNQNVPNCIGSALYLHSQMDNENDESNPYNLTLDKCMIYNNNSNTGAIVIDPVYNFTGENHVTVNSCTITNNTGIDDSWAATINLCLQSPDWGVLDMRDNIVWGNKNTQNQQVANEISYTGFRHRNINYSDIYNLSGLNQFITTVSNSMDANPQFQDIANYNYSLKWNSTVKSPCIMAGYYAFASEHFDRPDMGGLQYSAYPNEYYTYTFPSNSERNGIKWLSLPTIDRILDTPVD